MPIKHRRSNLSNEKSRLKYFLWTMIQKYQPRCYFCNEPFSYEDVLPPRGTDNLTEHHKDGDHQNMRLDNRTLSHRTCHKTHHVKDNILKEHYDGENTQ
jgi:hypothetical protein